MIYPWQASDYQHLTKLVSGGKSSGILLYGALNSGYVELIDELIKFMLCRNPQNNHSCDSCTSCNLFKLYNHPDYYCLSIEDDEKKTTTIKVEQIRRLIEFAATSAHVAKIKLIYLPNANELNVSSANSLLKILEEPPLYCRFILYAKNLNRILPTIRSRCISYRLTKPSVCESQSVIANESDSAFWLTYFDNEPFFIKPFSVEQLELLLNCLSRPAVAGIFMVSKELDPKKVGMAASLDFILKWLGDLLVVSQMGEPRYFLNQHEALQKLIIRLNIDDLFTLVEQLIFLRQWSEHPLNHKLQLESILFRYQQLFS